MGIIRLKEWLRGTKTGKGEVSLALALVPGLALVPVPELALAWMLDPDLDPDSDS